MHPPSKPTVSNPTGKHWPATLGILMVGTVAAVLLVLWQVSPDVFSKESASQASEWQSGLSPVECWFAVPDDLDVECAEMRTDPARGAFTLPVVVIRDHSPDHRDDPLVYLSGGPGNSSFLESRNVENWFYWADIANTSRDLVLVDQRGTGRSKPQFHCHAYEQFVRDTLRENMSLRQEHDAGLAVVQQCIGLMRAGGHSLSDYSTTHSARDMNEVMHALDYEEWNVMGGSYGTRLALDWLRLPENGIRAVVLDSVYPVDKGSLAEWPPLLDASFEYLWQACSAGKLCDEASGDLEERFWQAMAVLKDKPITLSIPLLEGGWPVKTVLNDHRFLSMIYTALYDDTLHRYIVQAIDEAIEGGDKALQKLAENSVNGELATEFNPLVYLAVDCSESATINRDEFEEVRQDYPKWSAYTEHAWQYDMCGPVPRRADLKAFKQAVETDLPTLILSGGFDPVTPAIWAQELAARLPNSQHWHLDDVGHGVVASSACVHQAFREFLDEPFAEYPMPCE